MTSVRSSPTTRIVLAYLLLSGLWILFSDHLLDASSLDAAARTQWSVYKGWLFVGVTGALLAALLSRESRARDQQDALRREAETASRESAKQLRSLQDNLPDSYVYLYPHETHGTPRFLHVSAGVETLHGLSVADVLRDASVLHRQISAEQLPLLTRELGDQLTEKGRRYCWT